MDQNYQSHGVRYKNGSNIVRNTCVALMLSVLVVSTLRSLISSDQPIKNRSGSSKSKLVARVPKVDWNAIKAGTSGQDPDCDKAYRKGKALEAMLREECSDSEYKDFKQLAAYGWTDWRTPNIDIKSLYLGPALKALKISEDKSKWMELAQGHAGTDLGKARADQKWPGTSAYYANYFNVEQGVIVAKNNQGPVFKNSRAATKDYLPAERIVPLRHLSDVVFLGYQDACQKAGQEVTKLEHVFRHQIANDETLYVWRAIADMDNLGPKFQWPGFTFKGNTVRALAALGTPNGAGVAWLFGQHKSVLGVKVIDQINIFECGDEPILLSEWCIYFHLVDADKP